MNTEETRGPSKAAIIALLILAVALAFLPVLRSAEGAFVTPL